MAFVIEQEGVGRQEIGGDNPTFIICEVGSTHCASLEIAKRLIDVVKDSGAHCVKFQKRDTKALLTKAGRDKVYNSPNAMAPTYGEHRDVMEFTKDEFIQLRDYALSKSLFFTASGWDVPSIDFLTDIKVPFIKIASADLTNLPLLRHIGQKGLPVILSTGMGSKGDVIRAYQTLDEFKVPIALLQCTSTYPTDPSEVNLKVIQDYKDHFNTVVGYSGHAKGYHIALASVAMGAKIVEKHITLDKEAKGSDHRSALLPEELNRMVQEIKDIEKALGSSSKQIQESEELCIKKLCKSVTSKMRIPRGSKITDYMITTKSPGDGIPARYFDDIIGMTAKVDIPEDTTLTYKMIASPDHS